MRRGPDGIPQSRNNDNVLVHQHSIDCLYNYIELFNIVVRTYVIHLLGTYVIILCYLLTKRTLLVFGQIQDVFNTSKNCVSRSSVEDMQVCQRFKLKKCYSLKPDSQLSIELKKLFQPRGSIATRQHLDRQLSVELYEKQNSISVLTLIRDYVFRPSFLLTLDI